MGAIMIVPARDIEKRRENLQGIAYVEFAKLDGFRESRFH